MLYQSPLSEIMVKWMVLGCKMVLYFKILFGLHEPLTHPTPTNCHPTFSQKYTHGSINFSGLHVLYIINLTFHLSSSNSFQGLGTIDGRFLPCDVETIYDRKWRTAHVCNIGCPICYFLFYNIMYKFVFLIFAIKSGIGWNHILMLFLCSHWRFQCTKYFISETFY